MTPNPVFSYSRRAGTLFSSTSRKMLRTPRPARWPRWVNSRLRDRPLPRWPASTAIDNISASSAAMRETAKPITLRPSLNRCTSVLRSLSMVSNSPSPQPRWNDAPCNCASRAASRCVAGSTTAVPPPSHHSENHVIMRSAAGLAAAYPLAVWHPARADKTAAPALWRDRRRHPARPPRRCQVLPEHRP